MSPHKVFYPRVLIFLGILVSSVPAMSYGQELSTGGVPKHVILIGWDGVGRSALKELMSQGKLPNVETLGSEGKLVAIDIMRMTRTKPGFTQILTGYMPEVTGVYTNTIYRPIPKGLSIFERIKSFYGPDQYKTVAVMGKKGSLKKLDKEGGLFYHIQEGIDHLVYGLHGNNEVGIQAEFYFQRLSDNPFFMFLLFPDSDYAGHRANEGSDMYQNAVISCDMWLGRLIAKLKELGMYRNTLIYVTADHGFMPGMKRHDDAPYIFLATNDKNIQRRGFREDIMPTILTRMGVPIDKISPPLDGSPLNKPEKEKPIW